MADAIDPVADPFDPHGVADTGLATAAEIDGGIDLDSGFDVDDGFDDLTD